MKKDSIFDKNPSLKEYFETSDGHKFYGHDLASDHAKKLKDKTVTKVTRGSLIVDKVIEGIKEKVAKKVNAATQTPEEIEATAESEKLAKETAEKPQEVVSDQQEEKAVKPQAKKSRTSNTKK